MADTRLSALIAPGFFDAWRAAGDGAVSELWLSGGRGSCKSSFCSLLIVMGLLRNPLANAMVYRKVADTLRDSVYAQMVWAVEQLGVGRYFQQRVSPMELVYTPTGQRVLFRGADKAEKSKGVKLARGYFQYLWFEELTEFAGMEDVRTIAASVLRGVDAHTLTLYSYNPPMSARSWCNEEALKRPPGRYTHHSTYLDVPEKWLGRSFLANAEALKAANERAYRHMYLGEVTGTGGQVFENVELRRIGEEEISRMGAFYNGLDFGYWPDPSHWVRVSYDPARLTVYVLDELRRYRTADRALAALLKEHKGLDRTQEIICDSASEKPLADLRAEGLTATGAMKGPGSVETGIRWLRTRRRIVIDPERTPETAREFQQYEHVKNRAGEYVEGYPDKDNHAIDAVRYALNRVWLRRDR